MSIKGDISELPYRTLANNYLESCPPAALYGPGTSSGATCARQTYFYAQGTPLDVSIGMPFNADDDPSTVIGALHQINQAVNDRTVEVVVGVSSEWTGTDGQEVLRQNDKYEALIELAALRKRRYFPDIQPRFFMTYIQNRTPQNAWRRVITSILADSLLQQRPLDYPILRFDAGTRAIASGTIENMATAIENNEAHLIKAPSSFKWVRSSRLLPRQLDELPRRERQAAHVAGIYALAKSIVEGQLGSTEERPYHEESGSGAQLGTWLRIMTAIQNDDPQNKSNKNENSVFLHWAKKLPGSHAAPFRYLDYNAGSHATISDQSRHLAERLRPWHIPLALDGLSLSELATESAPVQRRDVIAMVGITLLRQEQACGHKIDVSLGDAQKLTRAIHNGDFYADNQPLLGSTLMANARRLGNQRLSELEVATGQ